MTFIDGNHLVPGCRCTPDAEDCCWHFIGLYDRSLCGSEEATEYLRKVKAGDGLMECPECGGSGEQAAPVSDPQMHDPQRCGRCRGDGTVPVEDHAATAQEQEGTR